jgi:hypothetical protein
VKMTVQSAADVGDPLKWYGARKDEVLTSLG